MKNYASPGNPIIQPQPTSIPNQSAVAIPTSFSTSSGTSQPKGSMLTKIALGLLVVGIITVISYVVMMSMGKDIYTSAKTGFTQKDMILEQNLYLKAKDNPYRIFLNAKYSVKGDPFDSKNKLFDYDINLTDNQGKQIATNNGSYEYSKRSSSSDEKTSLSTETVNTSMPLKDFKIDQNGDYKLVSKIAVPDSLDSNFTLSDWNIVVKGKVLTPPALLIITGIGLVAASVLLLFIDHKRKSSH